MKHIYTYLTSNILLPSCHSSFKRAFLLLAVVLFGLSSNGQTTSEFRILNSTSCVGDTVSVPVSVRGLQGAGAISLVVDYDQTSLNFLGITSFGLSGTPIVNASGGEIRFSWADFSLGGSSLNDGILLNLRFVVFGSSSLTFDTLQSGNCEVANTSGVVNSTFQFFGGSLSSGFGAGVNIRINGLSYAPQAGGHQLYACGRQAYSVVLGDVIEIDNNRNATNNPSHRPPTQ